MELNVDITIQNIIRIVKDVFECLGNHGFRNWNVNFNKRSGENCVDNSEESH